MRSLPLILTALVVAVVTADETKTAGDFVTNPVKPGELSPLRWTEDDSLVHSNMYRLGLPKTLRATLKKYCDKMNITQMLMDYTVHGNEKPEGYEATTYLNGNEWFIQRPGSNYASNMHWISPNGQPAQDDFIAALSAGGFNDVLKSIGEQLKFDTLAAFQMTFLAVTHCSEGYVHWDSTETDDKTFVVIIPIVLSEEDSTPELVIQSEPNEKDETERGLYKYEYDVAPMLGDDAYHGTAPVDYRGTKQFRMAATIYISDINKHNAEMVAEAYSQNYPPNDPNLILSWSGLHWKKDGYAKMRGPDEGHVLFNMQSTEL